MDIKMADRLIELRKKNGFSQEDLADKLNISRQAVSKWERAESSPDTDNLIALSKLYNISIDDMLFNSNFASVENCKPDTLKISDDQADDFKNSYCRAGIVLGIGVAFILCAVCLLLFLMSTNLDMEWTLVMFFVALTVGVAIILYAAIPLSRFSDIEQCKKPIELTASKKTQLEAEYQKFLPKFFAFLIASICLILLSVIPVVAVHELYAVSIMLGGIALAVFAIVAVSFKYSVYEKLLNKNRKN